MRAIFLVTHIKHLTLSRGQKYYKKDWPILYYPSFPSQKDGTIRIFFQLFQGLERGREKTRQKFRTGKAWRCHRSYFWTGWSYAEKILSWKLFCTIRKGGKVQDCLLIPWSYGRAILWCFVKALRVWNTQKKKTKLTGDEICHTKLLHRIFFPFLKGLFFGRILIWVCFILLWMELNA